MSLKPRELATYPWSGHAARAGKERYTWMDTAYVLLQFAPTEQRARNAYRRFVQQGFSMGHVPDLTGGGLDPEPRGMVRGSLHEKKGWGRQGRRANPRDRHLRQLRIRNSGKTVAAIIEEECARNGIATHELASGSRRNKVSQARASHTFRCVRELGTPAVRDCAVRGGEHILHQQGHCPDGRRGQVVVMHAMKQRPQSSTTDCLTRDTHEK